VQNGQPTYPHDPIQTGDYYKGYYSGDGGSLNTSGFGNGYNTITLSSDGCDWINTTGWTKLCLRSSRDISRTTPTGNEYIRVYANEGGSGYQPKLVISYRNQSKIKNNGSTDIQGYLLIQVEFNDSGSWVLDREVINETTPQEITSGDQLGLDKVFNGLLCASDLSYGPGEYRVYTAFRDPDYNILRTDDGVELSAWWKFTLT